jgi:hypothetical protein
MRRRSHHISEVLRKTQLIDQPRRPRNHEQRDRQSEGHHRRTIQRSTRRAHLPRAAPMRSLRAPRSRVPADAEQRRSSPHPTACALNRASRGAGRAGSSHPRGCEATRPTKSDYTSSASVPRALDCATFKRPRTDPRVALATMKLPKKNASGAARPARSTKPDEQTGQRAPKEGTNHAKAHDLATLFLGLSDPTLRTMFPRLQNPLQVPIV